MVAFGFLPQHFESLARATFVKFPQRLIYFTSPEREWRKKLLIENRKIKIPAGTVASGIDKSAVKVHPG